MLPSSSSVPPHSSASSASPALAAAAVAVDALTQRGIAAVAALLSVADTLGSTADPTPAALAALSAEIRTHSDGVLDATWQIRSLARSWRGGGGGG